MSARKPTAEAPAPTVVDPEPLTQDAGTRRWPEWADLEEWEEAASPAIGAVPAYLVRMDVIQSKSGAGDPNTFAMSLIKGGLGGSTAGFDQLIADTRGMEQEIRAVPPPPSCEGYHQASLKALAESREIVEEMKLAFARRDFSGLATIAQKAGSLQVKAEALEDMRQRIISDAKP